MSRFIADENIPYPSFELLVSNGIDIVHVGEKFPSIADEDVIAAARDQNRLLVTLDNDHGELIFSRAASLPPGVIFFRIPQYRPTYLGELLLELISTKMNLEGFFTVVTPRTVRQRKL